MVSRTPRTTLFPYTTLFRSNSGTAAGLRRSRRDTQDGARSSASSPTSRPASPREHRDRKSTRLNSSHANISYAVFCLKKKITADLESVDIAAESAAQMAKNK